VAEVGGHERRAASVREAEQVSDGDLTRPGERDLVSPGEGRVGSRVFSDKVP